MRFRGGWGLADIGRGHRLGRRTLALTWGSPAGSGACPLTTCHQGGRSQAHSPFPSSVQLVNTRYRWTV